MGLFTTPLATMVWDTPTTDTTDTGLMLPLPTPGLLATPPPTPTTMVPTGILARGPLMLSLRPMLMLTTAPLGTMVWDTPTTMLPLPSPGLLAMPPPTPTTMVPTGISARGLLMLMLMLMPTTAPLATMVWDTPTTDSTDTGPMLPLPTTTVLTAMPPPTSMADTIIEQLILSSETQQSKASRYQQR